jgi:hypothetical protein
VEAVSPVQPALALQVAFERQILKPVFHLIGHRLWVWKVIGYGLWINLIQPAAPYLWRAPARTWRCAGWRAAL